MMKRLQGFVGGARCQIKKIERLRKNLKNSIRQMDQIMSVSEEELDRRFKEAKAAKTGKRYRKIAANQNDKEPSEEG